MFEEAVSTLTAVLVYAPQNAQSYYLRGKAFECLNEYKMALGDMLRAKELLTGPMASHVAEIIEELE